MLSLVTYLKPFILSAWSKGLIYMYQSKHCGRESWVTQSIPAHIKPCQTHWMQVLRPARCSTWGPCDRPLKLRKFSKTETLRYQVHNQRVLNTRSTIFQNLTSPKISMITCFQRNVFLSSNFILHATLLVVPLPNLIAISLRSNSNCFELLNFSTFN